MPFGRRKSNADTLENEAITGPSFRVLERTEVAPGKSFEAGARYAAGKPHSISSSKPIVSDLRVDDNLFADFKTNRYVICYFQFLAFQSDRITSIVWLWNASFLQVSLG